MGAMGPPSAKAMSLMCVLLCVAFVMNGFKGDQRIVPMHASCTSAHLGVCFDRGLDATGSTSISPDHALHDDQGLSGWQASTSLAAQFSGPRRTSPDLPRSATLLVEEVAAAAAEEEALGGEARQSEAWGISRQDRVDEGPRATARASIWLSKSSAPDVPLAWVRRGAPRSCCRPSPSCCFSPAQKRCQPRKSNSRSAGGVCLPQMPARWPV